MNRKFGWRGYIRDHRDDDHAFRMKFGRFSWQELPEVMDFTATVRRIEDQGRSNGCTGYSSSTFMEAVMGYLGWDHVELAPYFPYYWGRWRRGLQNEDQGAYIRDILWALKTHGICQLGLMPTDYEKINDPPSALAMEDAATRKIKGYYACNDILDVCAALTKRLPVIFGFSVYESFSEADVTGVVPFPKQWEQFRGGHAIDGFGFDRRSGGENVDIVNSYGDTWGRKGMGKLPFRYFEEKLANEAFAVEL